MAVRILLAAAVLLVLPACAPRKPAAPAAPEFDSQWDSYRNRLKEDEENARRQRAAAPAAPRTCSGAPAPVNPLIAEPLNAAKQAMYEGKYQVALDRTDLAIGLDPASAAAWEVRGSAFYTLGRLGEAKLAWTKALDLDPCLKEIPAFLDKVKSAAGGER